MVDETDPINDNEISFEEFLLMTAMQVETLSQLLIEKGIITEDEFLSKLKEVQAEYLEKQQT